MCGRFTRTYSWSEVHDFLDLAMPGADEMGPSHNVAPSQLIPVCRAGEEARQIVPMRWGFVPHWAKSDSRSWINARIETAARSPAFRDAFSKRRCLVPASGFYEWKKTGGHKQPSYIRVPESPIICFAGIWDRWLSDSGPIDSVAILTTEPNELVAEIHDRMPVIVSRDRHAEWLADEVPDTAFAKPFPAGRMEAYCVSTRVNRTGIDEPSLIDRAVDETLFG